MKKEKPKKDLKPPKQYPRGEFNKDTGIVREGGLRFKKLDAGPYAGKWLDQYGRVFIETEKKGKQPTGELWPATH